ncbi:hypothetical protein NMY22_g11187 [Coprinellus aureogranulatus]|nr:hypothetical protein NMY22_g11187 [Coprinellus aureogranulatus]
MSRQITTIADFLVPVPPLSPLESFLLRSHNNLVTQLIDHIPVYDALKIGLLNRHMRYLFDDYSRRTWNMLAFVQQYVNTPQALLKLMDGKDALIYGEAVLGFFLRSSEGPLRMDVCTTLPRFYDIQRVLWDDGFRIVPSHRAKRKLYTQDVVKGIVRRQHKLESSWFLTGDRSDDARSHTGFKFAYYKMHPRTNRHIVLNVHLIRCEPYRHILATEFTPLTCYMTVDDAVSPFALSTFRDGVALALQNKSESASKQSEYREFARKGHSFRPIFGPPFGYEILPSAEIGKRYMGDKHCWTIHRDKADPMLPVAHLKGPSFEVIDWTMLHDGEGTYMKIGEPFVWSSRYFYAIHMAQLAKLQRELQEDEAQFGGGAGGF